MCKVLIERAVITMNIFVIIAFYFGVVALISFAFVYANDTADIANDDFKAYEPSIFDLSEEERASLATIELYIKDTICPRYHHQILKDEINHYQNEGMFFIPFFFVNTNLSGIAIKTLGIEKWFTLFWLIAIIIGYACYFLVWLLYKKYSTERIISYCECDPSLHSWQSHYRYLLNIKKNVIFRYMLRNTLGWLAILFFVFVKVYYNT